MKPGMELSMIDLSQMGRHERRRRNRRRRRRRRRRGWVGWGVGRGLAEAKNENAKNKK